MGDCTQGTEIRYLHIKNKINNDNTKCNKINLVV